MRTILSFAVLLSTVAGSAPALAQTDTVPAPGAETSVPPEAARPADPAAQPEAPPRHEMGTAVPE